MVPARTIFNKTVILLLSVLIASTAIYFYYVKTNGLDTIAQAQIGKWERHVLSFTNNSYSGNPFELDFEANFTHSSGTKITLPGYYDGNDTWKLGFMPTRTGTWTYTTSSSDSDLNNRSGTLEVVNSGNPGMLKAENSNPRKWKLTDGDYVVPIALRVEFFSEPASTSDFSNAANFMANNNLHMMETRLLEEYGHWEGGRYDFIFEGNWQNHQFDLRIWQRMEERMDILAQNGLGAHIMFYSDDSGKPQWSAYSETEKLVFRYAIARLSGYPVVMFNSGIDIKEYRDCSWVDWFGNQLQSLDPYDHPVSSRYGGGSGSCVMNSQTFNSNGYRQAKVGVMINNYLNHSVPTSMDDAWGENRPSHSTKDHTPSDIRRAFWKATVAGGVGGLIRTGTDYCPHNGLLCIDDIDRELESEQWLRYVNPYIQNKFGDYFGKMEPDSNIADNSEKVYALSDAVKSTLLYFYIGNNDTYDANNGESMSINLSGLSETYTGTWFDTRKGSESSAGTFTGGSEYTINPPSSDDWILLLSSSGDTAPTNTPTPDQSPTPTPESPTNTPAATSTPASGGIISNLTVNDSNAWEITTNLQSGNKHYTDRNYSIDTVPNIVSGAEWIRTANDSKKFTGSEIAKFNVNKSVVVFVAHDDRISDKPNWLSDWNPTSSDLVNSEPQTFSLYKKEFSDGSTVVLGSNGDTRKGMYTVVVVERLRADADGDGDVDLGDFDIWEVNYNTTTKQGASKGDFNGDNKVDGIDYMIWRNDFTE